MLYGVSCEGSHLPFQRTTGGSVSDVGVGDSGGAGGPGFAFLLPVPLLHLRGGSPPVPRSPRSGEVLGNRGRHLPFPSDSFGVAGQRTRPARVPQRRIVDEQTPCGNGVLDVPEGPSRCGRTLSAHVFQPFTRAISRTSRRAPGRDFSVAWSRASTRGREMTMRGLRSDRSKPRGGTDASRARTATTSGCRCAGTSCTCGGTSGLRFPPRVVRPRTTGGEGSAMLGRLPPFPATGNHTGK